MKHPLHTATFPWKRIYNPATYRISNVLRDLHPLKSLAQIDSNASEIRVKGIQAQEGRFVINIPLIYVVNPSLVTKHFRRREKGAID